MRQIITVKVKESLSELRQLQKQNPHKFKALQMLIILKKDAQVSKLQLAAQTGASDKSIQTWRSKYLQGGIEVLMKDNRGGNKSAAITLAAHRQLSKRLNDPKEGFRSFKEVQHWLCDEFDIVIAYHAVNKYVKRRFDARLKVSRKSHVQKSPAAEAVFKKPIHKITGTSS